MAPSTHIWIIDDDDDDDESAMAMAEYVRHARGVLADLAEVGYDVSTVQELRDRFADSGVPYEAAIPVLIRWLPQVTYKPLKQDIARTLSVPWAQEAVPVLLSEFYRQPSDDVTGIGLRYALGNVLAVLADESFSGDLIAIANNWNYGESRAQVVTGLGKLKKTRPVGLLLALLDDPSVFTAAIEALGDLRAVEARDAISTFATHSDSYVRNRAKAALKKIDRSVKNGHES